MNLDEYRKEVKASERVELEDTLAYQIRVARLPTPLRQYRFAKEVGRNWAADFAWPDRMVIAEVDGGSWLDKGGHTTGAGFERDCIRNNTAALLGWTMLHFTGAMVKSGLAIDTLQRALHAPRDAA